MTILSQRAPSVLEAYYEILTSGIEKYGDGSALSPLLMEDFDFEGPIAGHEVGSSLFLEGVRGFIANVNRIDLVQEVHDTDGSAVIYDAHMPEGIVRLTEFFRFTNGRIQRLRLLYDPADYLAKGGA
ncbi:nuclear transport factor 2 family protein [Nesterenkonia marinintestina]|uniref:nuclear transport factor 2 family protein n=1 Tax=Nesterenkonia marinintestina TaxID=2979865 RepID=UPI0021C193B7|nr:nuclear transport factor 2 family protein [Nesterenkonia sp. GX14115]